MGNERSQPTGLVIEDVSFETANFWSLHSATYGTNPSKKVTVFVGATEPNGEVSALEKFSKNLMVNRHPNLLKYEASWKVNGQFHLATEEIQPLSHVLSKQSPFQICIGLNSIARALNFLHDKAKSSHNNVCQASIFVTSEGYWKLGGMEYLCPFSNINASFLAESRKGRYERGISPDEPNRVPQPLHAIDAFAFGILAEEILSKVKDEVPGFKEFFDLCKNGLQARDCSQRPTFGTILEHPYFTHDFINIFRFLTEIPLKSEEEKKEFFSTLVERLRNYDELVVARQLGGLLLSRLVLLDPTAQTLLLPKLLQPRIDDESDFLFSEDTLRDELVPRLISIFYVRDLQVRLTLLSYFSQYCSSFSISQLQSILPEILLGIKDTDNVLVSATLVALSNMVPLLGAATVVGGKRMKLFSDGRPIVHDILSEKKVCKPVVAELETAIVEERILSERHSPDGGEMLSITTMQDDDEIWNEWDNQLSSTASPSSNIVPSSIATNEVSTEWEAGNLLSVANMNSMPPPPPASTSNNFTPIEVLDLKNIEVKPSKRTSVEEVDFFSDMEPVISKASVLTLISDDDNVSTNKFGISSNEVPIEGWGDDSDWADINDSSD